MKKSTIDEPVARTSFCVGCSGIGSGVASVDS
jgi:hypothetical protein